MKRILQVFYSVFSSIIFSLAIQNELIPFGSPFLGLFALVPLYLAFNNAQSFLEAGLITGLNMALTNLISSFWLGKYGGYSFYTLGGTSLAYFVIGLLLGQFLYLPFLKNEEKKLHLLCGINRKTVILKIFFFAAGWTLIEWFKANGYLAYPWGTLSMSAIRWPLVTQIAAITGVYGVTFLFACFSAVFAEGLFLLKHTSSRFISQTDKAYAYSACLCIALFALTVFYGGISILHMKKPVQYIDAAVVQQNADPWSAGEEESIQKSEEYTKKTLEATEIKPDIIIWSEAVLSHRMPRSEHYYKHNPSDEPLLPFIKTTGIPFVIGGPTERDFYGSQRGVNSALYFDKDGNYVESYGKRWLVPFAENIPYDQYKIVQKFMQAVAGFSKGWVYGEHNVIFDLPSKDENTVFFSTPICFEDAFPQICREMYKDGAELFINLTNDSWSKTKTALLQHFAVASYRSIEFRTPMLRCANAGYSVLLNPCGQILDQMNIFSGEGKIMKVPVYKRTDTVYSKLGNWLPMLFMAMFLLYAVYLAVPLYKKPVLILLPEEKPVQIWKNTVLTNYRLVLFNGINGAVQTDIFIDTIGAIRTNGISAIVYASGKKFKIKNIHNIPGFRKTLFLLKNDLFYEKAPGKTEEKQVMLNTKTEKADIKVRVLERTDIPAILTEKNKENENMAATKKTVTAADKAVKTTAKKADKEVKTAAKKTTAAAKKADKEVKTAAKKTTATAKKTVKAADKAVKETAKKADKEVKTAAKKTTATTKKTVKAADKEVKTTAKKAAAPVKKAAKTTEKAVKTTAKKADKEVKTAAKKTTAAAKKTAKTADKAVKTTAKKAEKEVKTAVKKASPKKASK